jgi:hypothetical protein
MVPPGLFLGGGIGGGGGGGGIGGERKIKFPCKLMLKLFKNIFMDHPRVFRTDD